MATEKKNALIIAYNDLNNSGVPNVIYQTIKALHNEFDFDVVVFGNDLYHYQKLVDEGIENINVINWYKEGKRNKISRALNHLIKDPKDMYKRTLELLSKKEYSVIHSFREYDSWPFLKAAAEKGVQNRIVHSNVIHSEKDNYFQQPLRWQSRQVKLIFHSCKTLKQNEISRRKLAFRYYCRRCSNKWPQPRVLRKAMSEIALWQEMRRCRSLCLTRTYLSARYGL